MSEVDTERGVEREREREREREGGRGREREDVVMKTYFLWQMSTTTKKCNKCNCSFFG